MWACAVARRAGSRADTYLDSATIEVANQIVQYGWETGQSKSKTTLSEGLVALDADTVLVLRPHLGSGRG
jgi:hypothetical protein